MSKNAFPTGNLVPHVLAEFVPGQMSDEEFEALCSSIEANGQKLPIIIFEGKILDGRHRYRACKKLKIEPKLELFKGDEKDAVNFVVAMNLHRKQLNSVQKAMVGARMATRTDAPITQKEASSLTGVGVATINLCVRLLNSKNTPLIQACDRGEYTRQALDEELYDRGQEDDRKSSSVSDLIGDEDDDDEGDEGAPIGRGNEMIPKVGTKPTHPERKAKETPANACAQQFIGLDRVNKKSFIELVWFELEPLVRERIIADAKSSEQPAPTDTPTEPKAKTKAKKTAKKTKAET